MNNAERIQKWNNLMITVGEATNLTVDDLRFVLRSRRKLNPRIDHLGESNLKILQDIVQRAIK